MAPAKKATAAAKDTDDRDVMIVEEPAVVDVSPPPDVEAADDERTVEELKDELRDRDLPVSGTKAELQDRLADDQTASEPAAEAQRPRLLTHTKTVHTDGVAAYTDDAAALVEQARDNLAALASDLADFTRDVDDVDSSRYVQRAYTIRSLIEDAERYLGPLAAAVRALGTETQA